MTAFVALIWAMNLPAALLLLAQRMPDAAFALAWRLGLVVSLVGMSVAFPMTQETPSGSGRPTRPGSKKPPYRAPTAWASRTAGRGCP